MIRFTSAALAALVVLAPPPTTHVVRLESNRFAPAVTSAAPGDTIRFVYADGPPHNVVFVGDSIAKHSRKLIDEAMPKPKVAELTSPMLLMAGDAYTIVVPPQLGAGSYLFICSAHQPNMRGALVVTR